MNGPNWGILGAGYIAGKFARDYRYVKEGQIMAVASRSREKAESFAQTHGIEKAYEGYEALLADRDIDAIYVATPHSHHYEHTLAAIQHKKAVLCEKPAAVNTGQLKTMINAAKAHQVLFMEAMWTYVMPVVKEIKRWITSGEIGEVKLIQADFCVHMDLPPEHRINNPHLAGGSLLDVGIYPVAFTNLLLDDKVEEIQAIAQFGDTGVDDTTLMNLRFQKGTLAQLTCSTKHSTKREAYIFGTKGKIYAREYWKARSAILTTPHKEISYEDPREAQGYHYEIDEMNRLMREKKMESPRIPFAMSLQNLQILDDVRSHIKLTYPFEQQ